MTVIATLVMSGHPGWKVKIQPRRVRTLDRRVPRGNVLTISEYKGRPKPKRDDPEVASCLALQKYEAEETEPDAEEVDKPVEVKSSSSPLMVASELEQGGTPVVPDQSVFERLQSGVLGRISPEARARNTAAWVSQISS